MSSDNEKRCIHGDDGAPKIVITGANRLNDWTFLREGKEVAPYALTEAHLPTLERAIRAEGYRIMIEVGTDNITLVKD